MKLEGDGSGSRAFGSPTSRIGGGGLWILTRIVVLTRLSLQHEQGIQCSQKSILGAFHSQQYSYRDIRRQFRKHISKHHLFRTGRSQGLATQTFSNSRGLYAQDKEQYYLLPTSIAMNHMRNSHPEPYTLNPKP